MKTYTYTAFDGHPDNGGKSIPPMTDKHIKARDSYQALERAQDQTERYVTGSCDYVGAHRYYIRVWRDGLPLNVGYVDIELNPRQVKWGIA